MSNMSYCRFRNTLFDFQECADAVEALISGEDTDGELVRPLSPEELAAALQLIESAAGLLSLISEETSIDADIVVEFDPSTKRSVDSVLSRLNEEARTALLDEAAEEEDEDEDEEDDDFDDDDLDDDEEDEDDDDAKYIGEHQL